MKLPFSYIKNQSGYLAYFLLIGLIFIALLFTKLNTSPLKNASTAKGPNFCRELTNDPNPPTLQAPDYSVSGVNTSVRKEYKMIKSMVPVPYYFLAKTPKEHFFNNYEEQYTNAAGKKFLIKVPNGEGGSSYKLKDEDGQENYLLFADYGLLFLFHLDDKGQPIVLDEFEIDPGNFMQAMVADIYKATDKPDLPDWVIKCVDSQPGSNFGAYKNKGIYRPKQVASETQKELQLEYFLLRDYTLLLQAWWTPHCKPAVYLYPQKPMIVNVKVKPQGFLSYVDPMYDPAKGWTVLANPDGTLINQSFDKDNQKIYDYLYFESKIRDQLVHKPTNGWIIKHSELSDFYKQTLPQLGFNQKQQKDFIEYWQKSLPDAPYYFVSLIEPEEINNYEQLVITPKPDQVNRVRFYFEPRTELSPVSPLDLEQYYAKIDPNAKFTVFEWGGLFKRDKNHDFTCSM